MPSTNTIRLAVCGVLLLFLSACGSGYKADRSPFVYSASSLPSVGEGRMVAAQFNFIDEKGKTMFPEPQSAQQILKTQPGHHPFVGFVQVNTDALRKAGFSIAGPEQAADTKVTFVLAPSKDRPTSPPFGQNVSPGSDAFRSNFFSSALSMGFADRDLVSYVDATYMAQVDKGGQVTTFTRPLRRIEPFKAADNNNDRLEVGYAALRRAYEPELSAAAGEFIPKLSDVIGTAQ